MNDKLTGAGATFGYGHADASILLPVMVQHDRSRRDLNFSMCCSFARLEAGTTLKYWHWHCIPERS